MNKIYIFLLLAFIMLMFKSADERFLFDLDKFSISSYLLGNFKVGNSIIFNISVGYIVSFIFWLMNIVIPKKIMKKAYKETLIKDYQSFRKDIIHILLEAHTNYRTTSNDGEKLEDLWGNWELENKLVNAEYFKDFFKQKNYDNWYAVLNGLDKRRILDLYIEFELLERKIDAYITNFGDESKKAKEYYKYYTDFTYRLKNASILSEDQSKYVGNFLWELMGQWSSTYGNLEEDMILRIINKI